MTYRQLYAALQGNDGTTPLAVAANALGCAIITGFDATTGDPDAQIPLPAAGTHGFDLVIGIPGPLHAAGIWTGLDNA